MSKIFTMIFMSLVLVGPVNGQIENVESSIEVQGSYTSNDKVPFWMRANKHGSIPLPGLSLSVIGRMSREYDSTASRLFDWGMRLEVRSNLGQEAEVQLIEAVAKLKLSIFELKGGREKEISGLVDTTLSSGSIVVSGNSLGIPKVELSIPDFYTIPFLGNLFAVKGNFVQGWLGEVPIAFEGAPEKLDGYFHRMSFYGRLGKPMSKLKLYGGINHIVYWADEQAIFRDQFTISPNETYFYVVTGKKVVGSRYISRVGNQLGSIDVGFDYDFSTVKLFVYSQQFYEKGALGYLANLRDGLYGLSFSNKVPSSGGFQWRKMVFEVLYTKNQAGESWSKWTPSGPEHYYNHTVYSNGYSYNGLGIGTPFITPRHIAEEGQAFSPQDYFINNRVVLFHTGFEADVKKWSFISKISFSRNYGTYWTSTVKEFWYNGSRVPHDAGDNVFQRVDQLSAIFEGNKRLRGGLSLGGQVAFDRGDLLGDSMGGIVKIKKIFN